MGRKMKKAFKRFLRAARLGEIEILRECVEISGFEIDATDKYGKRALMYACENNRGEIATGLLKLGADPNLPDEEGWTPLLKATQCGYLPIVKLLVENKAEVNQVTTSVGRFALRQASSNGWLLCLDYLIKNGADINMVDYLNCTALCSPAYQGHLEVVECLLKAAANPNAKLNDGSTPLYVATKQGHLSVVKLLLAAGAETEIKNTSGCTPLMVACGYNRLSIVKVMCEAGCDINALTDEGETALHWAAFKGHYEVVEYLLQHGAISISNQKGKTPMYFAKEGNHTKVMNLLKNAANAKLRKSSTAESSETSQRANIELTKETASTATNTVPSTNSNELPNKATCLELCRIESGVRPNAKPGKTTKSEKLRKFGAQFFGKRSKATTSELLKIESDVTSGAKPRKAKCSAVRRIRPGAFFASVKQDLNGMKDQVCQFRDLLSAGVTKSLTEGILHGVFFVLDGWRDIKQSKTAASSMDSAQREDSANSDDVKHEDSVSQVHSACPVDKTIPVGSTNPTESADPRESGDFIDSVNPADLASLLQLEEEIDDILKNTEDVTNAIEQQEDGAEESLLDVQNQFNSISMKIMTLLERMDFPEDKVSDFKVKFLNSASRGDN